MDVDGDGNNTNDGTGEWGEACGQIRSLRSVVVYL